MHQKRAIVDFFFWNKTKIQIFGFRDVKKHSTQLILFISSYINAPKCCVKEERPTGYFVEV